MRFWTMLAHTQGELLNASKLATSLGVQSVTISRYLDVMVDLLLVRRLEPWCGNVKKRLVKSPRTYVRDSGLVHALLQIPNYEALLGHPIFGKSWEGFVVETIINALPSSAQASFYRTSAGAEIDLVIEFGLDEYWAVEIKASRTPTLKRGFHVACDDLKAEQKFVIYTGDDAFPSTHDTTILSLADFMKYLRKKTQ
jgi:Predicted ATPase (AAA+ superfamily)